MPPAEGSGADEAGNRPSGGQSRPGGRADARDPRGPRAMQPLGRAWHRTRPTWQPSRASPRTDRWATDG
eukprot:1251309-Alexandrium_andersonii.AAC.1